MKYAIEWKEVRCGTAIIDADTPEQASDKFAESLATGTPFTTSYSHDFRVTNIHPASGIHV